MSFSSNQGADQNNNTSTPVNSYNNNNQGPSASPRRIILYLACASPLDTQHLDQPKEKADIIQVVEQFQHQHLQIELREIDSTLDGIMRVLCSSRDEYENADVIFHLSCHGELENLEYDDCSLEPSPTLLCLELKDNPATPDFVDEEKLHEMANTIATEKKIDRIHSAVRILVLNSCHSTHLARFFHEKLNIDHVIAATGSVGDQHALYWFQQFYFALFSSPRPLSELGEEYLSLKDRGTPMDTKKEEIGFFKLSSLSSSKYTLPIQFEKRSQSGDFKHCFYQRFTTPVHFHLGNFNSRVKPTLDKWFNFFTPIAYKLLVCNPNSTKLCGKATLVDGLCNWVVDHRNYQIGYFQHFDMSSDLTPSELQATIVKAVNDGILQCTQLNASNSTVNKPHIKKIILKYVLLCFTRISDLNTLKTIQRVLGSKELESYQGRVLTIATTSLFYNDEICSDCSDWTLAPIESFNEQQSQQYFTQELELMYYDAPKPAHPEIREKLVKFQEYILNLVSVVNPNPAKFDLKNIQYITKIPSFQALLRSSSVAYSVLQFFLYNLFKNSVSANQAVFTIPNDNSSRNTSNNQTCPNPPNNNSTTVEIDPDNINLTNSAIDYLFSAFKNAGKYPDLDSFRKFIGELVTTYTQNSLNNRERRRIDKLIPFLFNREQNQQQTIRERFISENNPSPTGDSVAILNAIGSFINICSESYQQHCNPNPNNNSISLQSCRELGLVRFFDPYDYKSVYGRQQESNQQNQQSQQTPKVQLGYLFAGYSKEPSFGLSQHAQLFSESRNVAVLYEFQLKEFKSTGQLKEVCSFIYGQDQKCYLTTSKIADVANDETLTDFKIVDLTHPSQIFDLETLSRCITLPKDCAFFTSIIQPSSSIPSTCYQ
jgi:transcription termination factor NusB